MEGLIFGILRYLYDIVLNPGPSASESLTGATTS